MHLDKKNEKRESLILSSLKDTLELIQLPIFLIKGEDIVYSNSNYNSNFHIEVGRYSDVFAKQHHTTLKEAIRDFKKDKEQSTMSIDVDILDSSLNPVRKKMVLNKFDGKKTILIAYFHDYAEDDDAQKSEILENSIPYVNIKISKREKDVLRLASKGLNSKEIAKRLFISNRTVEKHRASLIIKLKASNFVQVIIYAAKHKIV